MSTDLTGSRLPRARRKQRAMMRWLLAVVATAFVELVALIALALQTFDDLGSGRLGAGGALAFAAATLVAVWLGARLVGAALCPAR